MFRIHLIAVLILVLVSLNGCAGLRRSPYAAAPQANNSVNPRDGNPNDGRAGQLRVTNYEECVAAGFATTKSFPPKCVTPNGQQFVKARAVNNSAGNCENMCGDGTCQQIVCQAVGCPCAETPVNCANDCASASF